MENTPASYEQPSWQDITVESIHAAIANDELEKARFLANLRLEALRGVVTDVEDVLQKGENTEVADEQWQTERTAIESEISELESIIITLDNQPELE